MKNKMPMKYQIFFVILALPAIIIPLVSLLTPYNLMINPLFMLYGMVFSELCALGIGMGTILLYDELGGGNGVFFFTHTGILYQYAWINSPYNQVPNDLKNYGSSPVILYNGDLQ